MAKRLHRNSSRPCLARAVAQVIRISRDYRRVPVNALGLKVSFGRDHAFLHEEPHCGLNNRMKCAVWRVAPAWRWRIIFRHRIKSLFEVK